MMYCPLFGRPSGLHIRAGAGTHRFIGIWFVIVKGRVFVRSWSVKKDGWYRVFLKESCGTIRTTNGEVSIRSIRIQSKSLRDAVDRAYMNRYSTPGALKYAKDLGRAKSRATTIELVPAAAP